MLQDIFGSGDGINPVASWTNGLVLAGLALTAMFLMMIIVVVGVFFPDFLKTLLFAVGGLTGVVIGGMGSILVVWHFYKFLNEIGFFGR